jgi:hypothetical protein
MKLKLFAPFVIVIGFGLGLFYAWQLSPVKFTEASPAQVIMDYRHVWLVMAAEAYAQDKDWSRTQERLTSLNDPDMARTITQLFDRYNEQGPNPIARALAILGDRYNVRTAAMLVYLSTPIVSTPIPTVAPRPTVRPTVRPTLAPTLVPITPTPAPTLIPTYEVINKVAVCHSISLKPQIQVTIQDANGIGIPGKEVWIGWDAGADRFVTGLKPEIDPGYGDFDMAIDQTYRVAIDKPTLIVASNLRAEECSTGRTTWQLVLRSITP